MNVNFLISCHRCCTEKAGRALSPLLPSGRRPRNMERSCRLDYVSRVASDLSDRFDPPMVTGVLGLSAWHFSLDRTGDWKLNTEISIGVC
jgi:hypothetical protein